VPTPAGNQVQLLENVNINLIYQNIPKSFMYAKHFRARSKKKLCNQHLFLGMFHVAKSPLRKPHRGLSHTKFSAPEKLQVFSFRRVYIFFLSQNVTLKIYSEIQSH
jgi:hypothetical protein